MRDLIVAEARKWLGTPYHHQGRVLGHGVDCYGVIEMVARGLGFVCPDNVRYSRLPDEAQLFEYMDTYAVRIDKAQMQDGDILLMPYRGQIRHMAIKTPIGMLHAYEPDGKVIEHGMDEAWKRMVKRVYSYKEAFYG